MKGKRLIGIMLLVVALVLAACSGNSGNSADSGKGGNQAAPGGSTGSGSGGAAAADNGPMTKYDPPIVVSMVRNLSDVVENNVLACCRTRPLKTTAGPGSMRNSWALRLPMIGS